MYGFAIIGMLVIAAIIAAGIHWVITNVTLRKNEVEKDHNEKT